MGRIVSSINSYKSSCEIKYKSWVRFLGFKCVGSISKLFFLPKNALSFPTPITQPSKFKQTENAPASLIKSSNSIPEA